MIIVLVREWFTLKCFVGDGVVWDENMIAISVATHEEKSVRFKKKGFIFSAIVKEEEEC